MVKNIGRGMKRDWLRELASKHWQTELTMQIIYREARRTHCFSLRLRPLRLMPSSIMINIHMINRYEIDLELLNNHIHNRVILDLVQYPVRLRLVIPHHHLID